MTPRGPAAPLGDVVVAKADWDGFYEVVGVKKPGGSGCWCMSYRDARLGSAERAETMRALCATEPGPGVIARVDGVPAGWCSVAARSSHRRLANSRTIPYLDDADPWSVVCFVVKAPFRRRGLMHHLLDGAITHVAAHGGGIMEGYPVVGDGAGVDVISGYVGTTALFEQHGFAVVGETTAHSGHRERCIVRRDVGPS